MKKGHMINRLYGGGQSDNKNRTLFRMNSPINLLDINTPKPHDYNNDNALISKKLQGKLSRGLEESETLQLNAKGEGISDVVCNEITDTLNYSLSTDQFYKLFKGYKSPSDVVEIVKSTANLDFSHVIVYWDSDIINDVILSARKNLTEVKYNQLRNKIVNGISKKLQATEPQFRSVLMKEIEFRRVPRLFFQNIHNEKVYITQSTDKSYFDQSSALEI